SSTFPQTISHAALGLDQFFRTWRVYFCAQKTDNHFQIVAADFAITPDELNQPATGDDAAGRLHKAFENRKLGSSERQNCASAPHLARAEIHGQIREPQACAVADTWLPGPGAQSGQQNIEGERLCEVVISPGIQTAHNIFRSIPGRK